MKNITAFVITLMSMLSLSASSGKIVMSGTVKNASVNSISIMHLDSQILVSADLDAKGHFTMSTKIEDGYYTLQYGRNSQHIYLYPNDDLKLSFDANHFESSLTFEGVGSERNNYLVNKSKEGAKLTEDLQTFYDANESNYLKNIEKVKNTHLASLAKYKVEAFFNTAEKKSLEYDRLLSIQNYKSNYKFYLGGDIKPSEGFYNPIKNVKLDNEEDFQKQPYYRYLVNSVWSERIDAAPDVEGMLKVLRKVPSERVAIGLVNGFYSKIASKKERAKDYLDLIKRVTKHQPFIDAAEKQYQEVMNSKGLKKGDTSPLFSYESIDGKTISLTDFKGKYVYIDVWATWCTPCIKQVPYLKALEERYHNMNIVFVSISVDKEEVKNKWKQMIADKQLGGVQLFADKSFDSDFMNAYAVNSIPRFLLIDPQGKILDTEAPRPSFDKTIELLDSLLK